MAKKTFEQAMKQLEQIVQDLESGDMPLEKAIKTFEDGIQLSKFCSKKLDETEKRITILMQGSDGKLSEAPFSGQNDDFVAEGEV
jgi:exodeoxyribonuclease VII small subunit